MYECYYDCLQPKFGSKVKLCHMDTDSFVYETGTKDIYKEIAKDVETKFNARKYSKDDNRPVPIGTNKKTLLIMKDEFDAKIITEFNCQQTLQRYKKVCSC